MATRRGRFAEHEDREIKERYGRISLTALARTLNRSPESVRNRAERLLQREQRTGRWTEDELRELRTHVGQATNEELSLIFARSVDSILATLAALRAKGCTSEAPLSREELIEFKRIYGTRHDRDLVVVFGRAESVIVETAERLCLHKDKAFMRKEGRTTRMPRWRPDELEKLKRMYPSSPNVAIARELGRSVKSVVSKAHNLGLKKNEARLRSMGEENVRRRYE